MVPSEADITAILTEIARAELMLDRELPSNGDLAERLDSVQRLTLVVAIEDRFRICFAPEDEEQARTLADVVAIVRRRLEEQAGA